MDFKMNLKGVCAKSVEFTMSSDLIVNDVKFHGGCPGNTIGVAKLACGMPADELIKTLSGIRCGFKATSCPDQFSKTLVIAVEKLASDAAV